MPIVSSRVPEERVRVLRDEPLRGEGRYVLYFMIAARRTRSSFALERAAEFARRLGKPLVVFEPLRVAYPHASDRLHAFVLEGMRENAEALRSAGAYAYPYVEPEAGAGRGLLAALSEHAAVVVTDDAPSFHYPHLLAAAARASRARLEAIDGNGLFPLRATDKVFTVARSYRAYMQKNLARHVAQAPLDEPLADLPRASDALIDPTVLARWPVASMDVLAEPRALAATLPIDHGVAPVATRGGPTAARAALERFVTRKLGRYVDDRNEPGLDGTSGLSPYLHFGHVGAHEVLARITSHEGWSVGSLGAQRSGLRDGFWGMSAGAEAFLEQLVVWRELGHNYAALTEDDQRYESLPDWARATLEKHAGDKRPHLYARERLDAAATHDRLWNAAQTELVREGRMHNYLRMLWGKKILEWSASPRQALATMIELNDRYALDGRDPNSYAGILWCLGRYDRPWGPERPIFGTVRYMSSDNTAKKLDVSAYLARYGRR